MIGDDDHGRPTWLTVAMGGAAGFLVGVVLVVLLSPDQDAPTRTVTAPPPRAAQPTATTPASRPPPPTTTTEPTVREVAVPDVAGEQLDVARERVEAAGFAVDVTGGGTFGVFEESNSVVATRPRRRARRSPPATSSRSPPSALASGPHTPAGGASDTAGTLPAIPPLFKSEPSETGKEFILRSDKVVLDRDDMRRTLVRIAREIVEQNADRNMSSGLAWRR